LDKRYSPLTDILDRIESLSGTPEAKHCGYSLRSAFQPIVSLGHQRTVGYEALIRATTGDGQTVTPMQLFGLDTGEAGTIALDRLCRALHVSTFQTMDDGLSWLFLNVNPVTIVHGCGYGSFFPELLSSSGFPPERVVVEILENALTDEHQLQESAAFYRDLGCLVAIDDFGVGHSSFMRIWQLKPHIVKLDRTMIVLAAQDNSARRMLPGMVSTLHEAGCLVLIEGIESEREAMIAMESDADLVQGWYFGRPAFTPPDRHASTSLVTGLNGRYQKQVNNDEQAPQKYFEYAIAMQQAINDFEQICTVQLDRCPGVRKMLGLPCVDRCYLLDESGTQIGPTVVADASGQMNIRQFGPLENAEGSNWIRRPYLRRALRQPGNIQITRPYLSVATGMLCITLSVAFEVDHRPNVLCCDINYREE
jgi:EAL domain-containing protein (putative c-di-GMP-specific phosphodiesterase class I)